MARAERPVDPTADPVQAFAAELRRLREAAGRPTYEALARRAHRSASSLSEAAGGRKLPTLDTALAYARALGGDEAEWADRWRAAATATAVSGPISGRLDGSAAPTDGAGSADRAGPAGGAGPVDGPAAPRGDAGRGKPGFRGRRTTGALALAAAMVAGFAAVPWLAGGFRVGGSPAAAPTGAAPPPERTGQPAAPAETREVRDGTDPKDTGCAADPGVTTVDSSAVLLDERVIGTVELRYAPACGASWPRFVPLPEAAQVPRPAWIQLTVFDGDDPSRNADFAMDYAGISTFGNMLTSTRTCVWAQVRLTGQGWVSPRARTGCWRGATQVRPIP
ncbi:helix-turn-helix domain-containing protein [Micromonospora sp. CA-263727]|uniref:helix-turn-helix domain-containing protein n=1 Tax=Micromonospora sp. CA-263727 TaxID=3239967 RepID=UPI003D8EE5AC